VFFPAPRDVISVSAPLSPAWQVLLSSRRMPCTPPDRKTVLLVDAENINGEGMVFEAYRSIERVHGPISQFVAFGAGTHLQHLNKAQRQLGLELVETPYARKNQADYALMRFAQRLVNRSAPGVLALASADTDFFPLSDRLRAIGIRMVCIGRSATLSKHAKCHFDECIGLDNSRMSLPQIKDKVIAILDCLYELKEHPVHLTQAVRELRKWRILPKSSAGAAALQDVLHAFEIAGDADGQQQALRWRSTASDG